jgi:hypothetical protein
MEDVEMDGSSAGGTPNLRDLGLVGDALPLSDERLAHLAPKLRALLADFQALEELAAKDTEPGISPWTMGSVADVDV